jgi:hypothetical protein
LHADNHVARLPTLEHLANDRLSSYDGCRGLYDGCATCSECAIKPRQGAPIRRLLQNMCDASAHRILGDRIGLVDLGVLSPSKWRKMTSEHFALSLSPSTELATGRKWLGRAGLIVTAECRVQYGRNMVPTTNAFIMFASAHFHSSLSLNVPAYCPTFSPLQVVQHGNLNRAVISVIQHNDDYLREGPTLENQFGDARPRSRKG